MICRMLWTLCAAALAVPISAQAPSTILPVGRAGLAKQAPSPVGTLALSVRGGIMVAPRGAGLAGVDIAVPSISLIQGWEGRLDADAVFKANFAEVKTIVPVTLNQVHYVADVTGRSMYYGFGAGALLGGDAKLVGKALLGVEIGPRLAIEGNVYLTNDKTLIMAVGRLHL